MHGLTLIAGRSLLLRCTGVYMEGNCASSLNGRGLAGRYGQDIAQRKAVSHSVIEDATPRVLSQCDYRV